MSELKERIFVEETGLDYELKGGVYYPVLCTGKEEVRVGKYGVMHLSYMIKTNLSLYNHLLLSGGLNSYLDGVNNQANQMLEIVKNMMLEQAEQNGEFDSLLNNYERQGLVNNIHICAEEIVLKKVVFCG